LAKRSSASFSLESLNVGSAETIHIQHFLRALKNEKLLNEVAAAKRTERALGRILGSLDNELCLQCRSCESSIPWDPIISLPRFQANLSKTLQSSLESSFKARLWCDKCKGYRDFLMSKADMESVSYAIFISDPALYRHFHELDHELTFSKDSCRLHLKVVLSRFG